MPSDYKGRYDAGKTYQPRRSALDSSQPTSSARRTQTGSQTSRSSQGGYNARPSQGSYGASSRPAQNDRYGQYGARTRQGSSQQGGRTGAYSRNAQSARRPVQSSARRTSSAGGQMPPIVKLLCLALVALIVVGVTVKITSLLTRDRRTPVASISTDNPQLVSNATDAPEQSEAPAAPTDTPEPDWQASLGEDTGEQTGDGTLRSVTIRTVGDIIMHDPLLETALEAGGGSTYSFDNYFSAIGSIMADADWTVANIEATLREGKYGYRGYPQFSTPPTILSTLKACGVDMLTMCNNHMLDGYWDGLRQSIDLVEQAGLEHVGAFRTTEEYNTPEIIEIGGIKVGFLNYTQSTNTLENSSDKAATEYGMRYVQKADFAQQTQALRDAGAEVIVGYMHWGDEYERTPESSTRRYAEQLVAAGVDIIVGGHPHMVQPIEYVTATQADGTTKTALVAYSIGNFISDQRSQYRDSGIIFEFTIQEQADGSFAITNPTYIPTYVWRWGDDSSGYDYRILSIGEYMDSPPAGMSESEYTRMRECWYEITNHLGGDTIATAAIR